MKKTTWVIIGLSVLVVALSIALVLVITQKKTETIIATELYDFSHRSFAPRIWQPSSSFSLRSDYTKTKTFYYYYGTNSKVYSISESELDKRGDFLGTSLQGNPRGMGISIAKRPYQTKEKKK